MDDARAAQDDLGVLVVLQDYARSLEELPVVAVKKAFNAAPRFTLEDVDRLNLGVAPMLAPSPVVTLEDPAALEDAQKLAELDAALEQRDIKNVREFLKDLQSELALPAEIRPAALLAELQNLTGALTEQFGLVELASQSLGTIFENIWVSSATDLLEVLYFRWVWEKAYVPAWEDATRRKRRRVKPSVALQPLFLQIKKAAKVLDKVIHDVDKSFGRVRDHVLDIVEDVAPLSVSFHLSEDSALSVEVEGLDLETNDAALATLDFPSEKSMMRFFRTITGTASRAAAKASATELQKFKDVVAQLREITAPPDMSRIGEPKPRKADTPATSTVVEVEDSMWGWQWVASCGALVLGLIIINTLGVRIEFDFHFEGLVPNIFGRHG